MKLDWRMLFKLFSVVLFTTANFYFLLGLGIYMRTGVLILDGYVGDFSVIVSLLSVLIFPAYLIADFVAQVKKEKK